LVPLALGLVVLKGLVSFGNVLRVVQHPVTQGDPGVGRDVAARHEYRVTRETVSR